MIQDVYLNGVRIHAFASDKELLSYVEHKKGILVAINAEKILHATEQTREIINRNIGYCDGMGAVMAMKKKGYKDVVKIPGCELWLKIIASLYQRNKLKNEFEGIQIVNYRNGYIQTEEEREVLIEDVVKKKPDVVFVAMGSPKQELLMEEMLERHVAIYQGLGGSFDVYTGNVKRAPKWWVDHGLEWAYRLVKQPSRIKRQVYLVKFLLLVKLGRI